MLTTIQILVVASAIVAAMLALVFFARWLVRWFMGIPKRRREARLREGGCSRCGYPLFPVQSRCPECGEPVRTL
jgi:hypothetical protein